MSEIFKQAFSKQPPSFFDVQPNAKALQTSSWIVCTCTMYLMYVSKMQHLSIKYVLNKKTNKFPRLIYFIKENKKNWQK